MIRTGLWIELEAVIGLIVGLGLASLLGQRTVPVILMIVLEIILTPLFSRARIPHLLNLQRSIVGVAMAHLTPGGLPVFGGGGGGPGGGAGKCLAGAGVCHLGRRGHRCVARRLDGPRSMADDDQRRLGNAESRADWPVTVASRNDLAYSSNLVRRPRDATAERSCLSTQLSE